MSRGVITVDTGECEMYKVGKQLVPLHVICGEWWEILKPDNTRLCAIVGNKEKAEEIVDLLNNGDNEDAVKTPSESPDYDPSQSPKKR